MALGNIGRAASVFNRNIQSNTERLNVTSKSSIFTSNRYFGYDSTAGVGIDVYAFRWGNNVWGTKKALVSK